MLVLLQIASLRVLCASAALRDVRFFSATRYTMIRSARDPLKPPYPPMEAQLVEEIPTGEEWQYEPKWDGFRCVAFRDGEKIELQSKAGQSLTRYFPDVVAALAEIKARHYVLDGEIVVPINGALSFDDLLQRIHPAESRVKKLAAQTPGTYIVFDLLSDEKGRPLVDQPLENRRAKLEAFAADHIGKAEHVKLSPATRDIKVVKKWFSSVGSSLDGVIAKRLDLPYQSGNRDGMVKIKNMRTAECVVGGFRYGSKSDLIGSLLLGLYDDAGLLHHVGFTSSIKAKDKPKLTQQLKQLQESGGQATGFTGRAPGGPSRWSTEPTGEWEALPPKLVVEVQYDHFSGGRFRHGTKLLRWRPDKPPKQCTMDQVAHTKKQMVLW
jgi:ATP-dependent DNA ligase